MGLRGRRGERVAAVLLLLLAVGAGCSTGDDEGRDDGGSTPSAPDRSTTPAEAEGEGLGGSRYLAYTVRTTGDRHELVLEDLVEETSEVVTSGPTPLGEIDVDASGAVAWDEQATDETSTTSVLAPDADEPVTIDGEDVACPRWRMDGTLVVLVLGEDGETAVPTLADPATGEIVEELPITLDPPTCVVPDGMDHVVLPRPVGEDTYGPGGAEIVRVALDGSDEEVVGHVPPWCWADDVDVSAAGDALAAGIHCGPEITPGGYGLHIGTMEDDLAPVVAENAPDVDPAQAHQYGSPAWSADGRQLAYHRSDPTDEAGSPHVWVVDRDDGAPVDRGPVRSAEPSLSPAVGGGRD